MNDQKHTFAATALAGATLDDSNAAQSIRHAHMDDLEDAIHTFLAQAERVKQRGEPLHTAPEMLEARERVQRINTSIRQLL
jgi:hypothetical protein